MSSCDVASSSSIGTSCWTGLAFLEFTELEEGIDSQNTYCNKAEDLKRREKNFKYSLNS